MFYLFSILLFSLLLPSLSWSNYGPPPPPQKNFIPYIPNNNVALGYPTAYGLGNGFVKGNGRDDGGPSPTNVFPIRCSNGGAHIGNCRLDVDAICKALGGVCINSVCCTVPFFEEKEHNSNIKKPSSIIDIEIINEKSKKKESEEEEYEEEDDDDNEDNEKNKENLDEKLDQIKTIDFEMKQKLMELKELYKLIDENKKELMSPPSTTTSTITKTIKKTVCENGMKPIGPCVDNSTCPINYSCESNEICCFQI